MNYFRNSTKGVSDKLENAEIDETKDETQLRIDISKLERRLQKKKKILTKLLVDTSLDCQQKLVKKHVRKEIKSVRKRIIEKVKIYFL